MKLTNKKTYWAIGILLIMTIAVIIAQKFKSASEPATTPQPIPSQKPIQTSHGPAPKGIDIIFTGKAPALPATLGIYSNQSTNPLEYAQSLALELNLPSHPQSDQLWTNNDLTLNYDKSTGIISISYKREIPTNPGLSKEQAVKLAKDYMENLTHDKIFTNPGNILLLDNRPDYIGFTPKNNKTPSQTYKAVVPYTHQVNNFPLFYNDLNPLALKVIINSNAQVVTASLIPPPVLKLEGQANSIEINDAIQNLKNGQAAYLKIDTNDPIPSPASDLTQLTLTSADVEYRIEVNTGNTIPYYHFYGQGLTKQQKKLSVSVVTPAIKLN